MDEEPSTVSNRNSKHARRRITKSPPTSLSAIDTSSNNNSTAAVLSNNHLDMAGASSSASNQRSNTSIQRTPSAPVYPRSYGGVNHSSHQRKITSPNPSAYATNASIDRQVNESSSLDPASDLLGDAGISYPTLLHEVSDSSSSSLLHRASREFLRSTSQKSRKDPSSGNASTGPSYQNSLRKPPPSTANSTIDTKMISPPLRQSASFSGGTDQAMDVLNPQSSSTSFSSKRYSDEAREPRNSLLKKKGGLSNFVNNLVGSPRRPNISAPENPVHVTHVGYDNETGQYTVKKC